MRERIQIQAITTSILFGGDTNKKEGTFLEREKRAEKELYVQLKKWGCLDILEEFQEYRELAKEVYFETCEYRGRKLRFPPLFL